MLPAPAVPEPTPRPVDPAPADLTIRLFGLLREQAGWSERRWPCIAAHGRLTPRAIWRDLGAGESPLPESIRVAVNHRFVSPDSVLRPGDELAFLPPITGG